MYQILTSDSQSWLNRKRKKKVFSIFNLFFLKNRLYKDRKQCITFYSLLKTEWKIKFHSALSFEKLGIYCCPKKQFKIFSCIYIWQTKNFCQAAKNFSFVIIHIGYRVQNAYGYHAFIVQKHLPTISREEKRF